MQTTSGMVKGAALREFLLWFEQHYGTEYRAEVAARLPDELRTLGDETREAFGLLASNWYPMELVHVAMDAMVSRISPDEMEHIALKAGPAVFRSQMTGLQRRAFRLLVNPDRYRKYVSMIWRQNFDSGDVEVLETAPREHHGFIRNWRGHHPLICSLIQAGKVAIYEEMGCKDVSIAFTGCVSKGADACSSKVRWS
jgi:hypothetical protein